MTLLRDKELVDYLSRRVYVEATDMGQEDPNRFQYNAVYDADLRAKLSAHILTVRRKGSQR